MEVHQIRPDLALPPVWATWSRPTFGSPPKPRHRASRRAATPAAMHRTAQCDRPAAGGAPPGNFSASSLRAVQAQRCAPCGIRRAAKSPRPRADTEGVVSRMTHATTPHADAVRSDAEDLGDNVRTVAAIEVPLRLEEGVELLDRPLPPDTHWLKSTTSAPCGPQRSTGLRAARKSIVSILCAMIPEPELGGAHGRQSAQREGDDRVPA
jgi:hypothetical protein